MRILVVAIMFLVTGSAHAVADPLMGSSTWNNPNTFQRRSQVPIQQQQLEEAYQYLLGSQGKAEDPALALQLVVQGAENGYLPAQALLGVLYAQGRTVKADRQQAIFWLEKAAYRNHPVAQYHLGLLMATTQTQSQDDLIDAYVWWRKAAEQGNARAQVALKELDYRLTPADKAKGQALWEQRQTRIVEEPPMVVTDYATESVVQPDDLSPGEIKLNSVSGRWVRSQTAGNLFVISGQATNAYSVPRSNLVVIAMLQDPQGQVLMETIAYGGNAISDPELMEMPFEQVLQAMKNAAGVNQLNQRVAPGQSLPFTVVFKDVPSNVAQYTVKSRSLPVQ